MVRVEGLEPPRQSHWYLKPARLPIPPHPHSAPAFLGGALYTTRSRRVTSGLAVFGAICRKIGETPGAQRIPM